MASTDLIHIRTEGNPNISDAPPPKTWNGDAARLESLLRSTVRGDVRFTDGDRALYTTDGSNYRQIPIGIVLPRDKQDVINTVAACRELGAPILARGGGTSLAGQCCNVAVVLDFSRYMNRVLEINKEQRYAVVEPGVILDDLRNQATKVGLTYGPDPATHNRCTLGGMIGNNSCGVHSIISGRTSDNIHEMEILLYDGTLLRVGPTSDDELQTIIFEGGRRGEIYSRLRKLRDRYAQLVKEKFPNIPRRVSGYSLDALLPQNNFDLAQALVGSECTCALVLEAKVRLIENPTYRALVVLGYSDVFKAGDHVKDVMTYGPIGLEGMDGLLIEFMKRKNLRVKDLSLLPEGKGWLLVEFGAQSQEEANAQARAMMESLRQQPDAPNIRLYEDKRQEKLVWEIRESGLGATAFVPGEPLAWEGWEDSAVDPARIGDYLRELTALMAKYGYRSAMYGHFGHGCVHMRINFDLFTAEGIRKYREYIHEAAHLVVKYGGSLSGEHGDGQSRGELLPIMFGPELIAAFQEFKEIWDPDWKMNPGKLIKAYRADENLRFGADHKAWDPGETHFHFTDDRGKFSHATSRCVGVGQCRRNEGKTMCPSYRVLQEEMHSTRGRTHLLWEMFKGEVITDGWKNDKIHEALEYCLACKGCKGDCPVNVDVATYKAEFLSHYYEEKIRPRHAYMFCFSDLAAAFGSKIPGIANFFTQTPIISDIVKWVAGLSAERQIPAFPAESFVDWFRKRPKGAPKSKRVMLWPDTWNNYYFPSSAKAAVEVLESAGFEVVIPTERVCCGRPLYDFGMLDRAKRMLLHVMDVVGDEALAGTEIVGLEPSCVTIFRDELVNLFPDDPRAHALKKQVKFWAEFFEEHKDAASNMPRMERAAVVHGHCHEKALSHMDRNEELLKHLGMDYKLPQNGCCGLAGSFGFERKKHPLSIKIAEKELLPHIHDAPDDTFIIADGFSCREQIHHTTGRRALHTAEVMQMALHSGPKGPMKGRPEREIVEQFEGEVRSTLTRAIAGIGAAAVAGAAALIWYLKTGKS